MDRADDAREGVSRAGAGTRRRSRFCAALVEPRHRTRTWRPSPPGCPFAQHLAESEDGRGDREEALARSTGASPPAPPGPRSPRPATEASRDSPPRAPRRAPASAGHRTRRGRDGDGAGARSGPRLPGRRPRVRAHRGGPERRPLGDPMSGAPRRPVRRSAARGIVAPPRSALVWAAENCSDPDVVAWARYDAGRSYDALDRGRRTRSLNSTRSSGSYPGHRLADDARFRGAEVALEGGRDDEFRARLAALPDALSGGRSSVGDALLWLGLEARTREAPTKRPWRISSPRSLMTTGAGLEGNGGARSVLARADARGSRARPPRDARLPRARPRVAAQLSRAARRRAPPRDRPERADSPVLASMRHEGRGAGR